MKVEWGGLKISLLFLALLCEQLGSQPALPIEHGVLVKSVAGVVSAAAAGSFVYLLRPPSQEKKENEIEDSVRG